MQGPSEQEEEACVIVWDDEESPSQPRAQPQPPQPPALGKQARKPTTAAQWAARQVNQAAKRSAALRGRASPQGDAGQGDVSSLLQRIQTLQQEADRKMQAGKARAKPAPKAQQPAPPAQPAGLDDAAINQLVEQVAQEGTTAAMGAAAAAPVAGVGKPAAPGQAAGTFPKPSPRKAANTAGGTPGAGRAAQGAGPNPPGPVKAGTPGAPRPAGQAAATGAPPAARAQRNAPAGQAAAGAVPGRPSPSVPGPAGPPAAAAAAAAAAPGGGTGVEGISFKLATPKGQRGARAALVQASGAAAPPGAQRGQGPAARPAPTAAANTAQQEQAGVGATGTGLGLPGSKPPGQQHPPQQERGAPQQQQQQQQQANPGSPVQRAARGGVQANLPPAAARAAVPPRGNAGNPAAAGTLPPEQGRALPPAALQVPRLDPGMGTGAAAAQAVPAAQQQLALVPAGQQQQEQVLHGAGAAEGWDALAPDLRLPLGAAPLTPAEASRLLGAMAVAGGHDPLIDRVLAAPPAQRQQAMSSLAMCNHLFLQEQVVWQIVLGMRQQYSNLCAGLDTALQVPPGWSRAEVPGAGPLLGATGRFMPPPLAVRAPAGAPALGPGHVPAAAAAPALAVTAAAASLERAGAGGVPDAAAARAPAAGGVEQVDDKQPLAGQKRAAPAGSPQQQQQQQAAKRPAVGAGDAAPGRDAPAPEAAAGVAAAAAAARGGAASTPAAAAAAVPPGRQQAGAKDMEVAQDGAHKSAGATPVVAAAVAAAGTTTERAGSAAASAAARQPLEAPQRRGSGAPTDKAAPASALPTGRVAKAHGAAAAAGGKQPPSPGGTSKGSSRRPRTTSPEGTGSGAQDRATRRGTSAPKRKSPVSPTRQPRRASRSRSPGGRRGRQAGRSPARGPRPGSHSPGGRRGRSSSPARRRSGSPPRRRSPLRQRSAAEQPPARKGKSRSRSRSPPPKRSKGRKGKSRSRSRGRAASPGRGPRGVPPPAAAPAAAAAGGVGAREEDPERSSKNSSPVTKRARQGGSPAAKGDKLQQPPEPQAAAGPPAPPTAAGGGVAPAGGGTGMTNSPKNTAAVEPLASPEAPPPPPPLPPVPAVSQAVAAASASAAAAAASAALAAAAANASVPAITLAAGIGMGQGQRSQRWDVVVPSGAAGVTPVPQMPAPPAAAPSGVLGQQPLGGPLGAVVVGVGLPAAAAPPPPAVAALSAAPSAAPLPPWKAAGALAAQAAPPLPQPPLPGGVPPPAVGALAAPSEAGGSLQLGAFGWGQPPLPAAASGPGPMGPPGGPGQGAPGAPPSAPPPLPPGPGGAPRLPTGSFMSNMAMSLLSQLQPTSAGGLPASHAAPAAAGGAAPPGGLPPWFSKAAHAGAAVADRNNVLPVLGAAGAAQGPAPGPAAAGGAAGALPAASASNLPAQVVDLVGSIFGQEGLQSVLSVSSREAGELAASGGLPADPAAGAAPSGAGQQPLAGLGQQQQQQQQQPPAAPPLPPVQQDGAWGQQQQLLQQQQQQRITQVQQQQEAQQQQQQQQQKQQQGKKQPKKQEPSGTSTGQPQVYMVVRQQLQDPWALNKNYHEAQRANCKALLRSVTTQADPLLTPAATQAARPAEGPAGPTWDGLLAAMGLPPMLPPAAGAGGSGGGHLLAGSAAAAGAGGGSRPRVGEGRQPGRSAAGHPPAMDQPYCSPLLRFRTYRLSPHFPASAAVAGEAGTLSDTYCHGADPQWPLCLLDTQGVHAVPCCNQQHQQDIQLKGVAAKLHHLGVLLQQGGAGEEEVRRIVAAARDVLVSQQTAALAQVLDWGFDFAQLQPQPQQQPQQGQGRAGGGLPHSTWRLPALPALAAAAGVAAAGMEWRVLATPRAQVVQPIKRPVKDAKAVDQPVPAYSSLACAPLGSQERRDGVRRPRGAPVQRVQQDSACPVLAAVTSRIALAAADLQKARHPMLNVWGRPLPGLDYVNCKTKFEAGQDALYATAEQQEGGGLPAAAAAAAAARVAAQRRPTQRPLWQPGSVVGPEGEGAEEAAAQEGGAVHSKEQRAVTATPEQVQEGEAGLAALQAASAEAISQHPRDCDLLLGWGLRMLEYDHLSLPWSNLVKARLYAASRTFLAALNRLRGQPGEVLPVELLCAALPPIALQAVLSDRAVGAYARGAAHRPGCYQMWATAAYALPRWQQQVLFLLRGALSLAASQDPVGVACLSPAQEDSMRGSCIVDLLLRLLRTLVEAGQMKVVEAWAKELAAAAATKPQAVAAALGPPAGQGSGSQRAALHALRQGMADAANSVPLQDEPVPDASDVAALMAGQAGTWLRYAVVVVLHWRPLLAQVVWTSLPQLLIHFMLPTAVEQRLGHTQRPVVLSVEDAQQSALSKAARATLLAPFTVLVMAPPPGADPVPGQRCEDAAARMAAVLHVLAHHPRINIPPPPEPVPDLAAGTRLGDLGCLLGQSLVVELTLVLGAMHAAETRTTALRLLHARAALASARQGRPGTLLQALLAPMPEGPPPPAPAAAGAAAGAPRTGPATAAAAAAEVAAAGVSECRRLQWQLLKVAVENVAGAVSQLKGLLASVKAAKLSPALNRARSSFSGPHHPFLELLDQVQASADLVLMQPLWSFMAGVVLENGQQGGRSQAALLLGYGAAGLALPAVKAGMPGVPAWRVAGQAPVEAVRSAHRLMFDPEARQAFLVQQTGGHDLVGDLLLPYANGLSMEMLCWARLNAACFEALVGDPEHALQHFRAAAEAAAGAPPSQLHLQEAVWGRYLQYLAALAKGAHGDIPQQLQAAATALAAAAPPPAAGEAGGAAQYQASLELIHQQQEVLAVVRRREQVALQCLLGAVQAAFAACGSRGQASALMLPVPSYGSQELQARLQPAPLKDAPHVWEAIGAVLPVLPRHQVVVLVEYLVDLCPPSQQLAHLLLQQLLPHASDAAWAAWLLPLLLGAMLRADPGPPLGEWLAVLRVVQVLSPSAVEPLLEVALQQHPWSDALWAMYVKDAGSKQKPKDHRTRLAQQHGLMESAWLQQQQQDAQQQQRPGAGAGGGH